MNAHAVDRDLDRLSESWVAGRVGVAEDSLHGRDERELVQDRVASHIARVEDELDARERRVHLRARQAMGVGDQANDMPSPLAHASSGESPQRLPSWCSTPS